MQKIIIEFSLVIESKRRTKNEIIKEIAQAFENDNIMIPWCEKVEKITINKLKSNYLDKSS